MTETVRPDATSSAESREWENEGGAIRDRALAAVPDGITSIAKTEYRVGPYRYTNLDDAVAEKLRQESNRPD